MTFNKPCNLRRQLSAPSQKEDSNIPNNVVEGICSQGGERPARVHAKGGCFPRQLAVLGGLEG